MWVRNLFNSVALYILLDRHCGNSCKSWLLISSVVLCFVPTGNTETNCRFSVVHATKIPPCLLSQSSSFGLYCCEKFAPAFFLSDVSQRFWQHYTCLCVTTKIHQALWVAVNCYQFVQAIRKPGVTTLQ